MTLRQKLACVGLTVFGLQIASAAAGGAPLEKRPRPCGGKALDRV